MGFSVIFVFSVASVLGFFSATLCRTVNCYNQIRRDALRKYGRGRHAAALNFGDRFVYALAKTLGELLLVKGADSASTDIESCKDI